MERRYGNLIDGENRGPASGGWLKIDSPTTGRTASEIADSSLLDVVQAIQAANKAFVQWQKVDDQGRADLLFKIAREIELNSSVLAGLQAQETGSTLQHATNTSIIRAAEIFRFSARALLSRTEVSLLTADTLFTSNRLPLGIVTVILGWSDPLVSVALRVAPALAAGNVVILKPSSRTPGTAHAFAETLLKAGLPPGVFGLLLGRGDEVGRALVSHPALTTISFTGRRATASDVMATAAEYLKRVDLHLGGANAVLVFAETDIEKTAAEVAKITFAHQGAMVLRGSRIFIQETIYDKFLDALKAESEKIIIGDPLDLATTLGPVCRPEDFKLHLKAVAQATAEKGKPLFGGAEFPGGLSESFQSGRFVRPAAFFDLTLCSTLQQEELAGPFASIASFKYQHDAIKQANNSAAQAHAIYVFNSNASKVSRMAAKIAASRVLLNGSGGWDPRIDAGGFQSARSFSKESVLGFAHAP